MAKVSLRIYNRDIENLIDQGHLDEAIAHCRHILKTFPKHLETYRLLGKAYLEAKRYDEAVDVLQRVLMSVPDDFVSHVGMSIIRDDQGKLDDAIWHMERAFESQPSNAAIQGELRRLYGRRDGVEPPKIRMTRGALAHMYVQGELYPQAISEIKAVLSQDPQRVDMQVLLALAYFRSGQKADASQIANQLLNRAGGEFGYEANRIMVELLQGSDSAEDLESYRQHTHELDPYAALSQGSVFQSGMVSDAAVTLERLEYDGQIVETSSAWNPSGISLTSPGQQPEWLSGAASTADEGPASVSTTQEDIPDFLRQAGWSGSTGAAEETTSQFAFEQTPPVSQADLAPGEMPDWLKAMSPADSAPSVASQISTPVSGGDKPDWLSSPGDSVSSFAKETPITSEDTPSWLRSFREETQQSEPLLPDDTIQDSAPMSWPEPETPIEPAHLGSLAAPESTASLETLGTTAQEQDDAVAWLEGLAAKHGAKPEELVTDPNARSETPPEWVEQARAIAESMPPVTAPEVSSPIEPALDDDRTGIWLREMAEKETLDEIVNNSVKEGSSELQNDEDAPAWLKNIDDAALEGAPSSGFNTLVPDLSAWGKGESESESELLPSAADLPSWLQGLDKEEEAVQTDSIEPVHSTADDASLPAWLKGGDEDIPVPSIPPTTPTDWQPVLMETESETELEPEAEALQFAPPIKKTAAPKKQPTSAEGTRPASQPRQPEAQDMDAALESAQADLNRGDIPAALDRYGKLIKRGRFTEEIIRDLREALYRYPVEVTIWQTLGDAYMRANRLQEALDAYTKAEELLR